MNFNTKKCKLLPITRKRSSISAPLLLDGTPLEAATEISDLGLLTDYKLSYNTRKTNVVLGLHRRNCRDLRDISTLRTLYYALVRPEAEYHYQKYRDTKYTKCCEIIEHPGRRKTKEGKTQMWCHPMSRMPRRRRYQNPQMFYSTNRRRTTSPE